MELMKRKSFSRVMIALGLLLLSVALLPWMALQTGAQAATTPCDCANGYVNGFCEECGYQPATLNAGDDAEGAYDDVYEVGNMGQLYWMADYILKHPSTPVSIRLTANIVVNEVVLDDVGALVGTPERIWVPFGTEYKDGAVVEVRTVKNVSFDGAGYYISGLYNVSDDDKPAGLFGKTQAVHIRNLGIVNSYFASENEYAGAIVGEVVDCTEITYCYARAVVLGTKAAGLVGKLGYTDEVSVLRDCYTTIPAVAYEVAAENTVAGCYYQAVSELDALDGTTYFAPAQLSNGELLATLNGSEPKWSQSCVSGLVQLNPEHSYIYPCDHDCRVCNAPNRPDAVDHQFSGGCEDVACDVCSRIREPLQHSYSHPCDTTCDNVGCSYTRTVENSHKYSNQCDASCNYCGETRTVPGHNYTNACDKDCNYCSAERTVSAHVYDNSCDEFCNVCGTLRADTHTYAFACDEDCDVCGKTRTTKHTWQETVTIEPTHFDKGEMHRTCSVCGKTEVVVLDELEGLPVWLIVVICVGGAVVLGVGGFLLYWCVVKKRSIAQLFGRSPEQLKEKERKQRKADNRRRKQEKKEAKKAVEEEAKASETQTAENENTEEEK